VNERNEIVARAVAAAGIEPAIRILDADVKTAAAAAERLGCEVGAIANSLVFSCDGEPLLVMASGAARVDTDLLAKQLEAEQISRATPQFVKTVTSQVIGGVAPTGHPSPLRTVVDESLQTYPLLWAAAGTPDSVMPLTYDQLLALTGGRAMRVR
jgi:prolyl-tRNA editing enzyme YbaK/EbsC (Cys-tRNA(Pro) deacylase)